jgi:hypothetical protein
LKANGLGELNPGPSPCQKIKYDKNDDDHKNYMDQTSAYVQQESQQPQHKQHGDNRPEYTNHFVKPPLAYTPIPIQAYFEPVTRFSAFGGFDSQLLLSMGEIDVVGAGGIAHGACMS